MSIFGYLLLYYSRYWLIISQTICKVNVAEYFEKKNIVFQVSTLQPLTIYILVLQLPTNFQLDLKINASCTITHSLQTRSRFKRLRIGGAFIRRDGTVRIASTRIQTDRRIRLFIATVAEEGWREGTTGANIVASGSTVTALDWRCAFCWN